MPQTIDVISDVGLVLIILLLGIKAVFDVGHYVGLLPGFIQRRLEAKEESATMRVLRRLGIVRMIPEIKEMKAFNDIDPTELSRNYKGVAEQLIKPLVEKRGAFTIGRHVRMSSPYYVGLREALVEWGNATTAAKILAAFIRDTIKTRGKEGAPVNYDLVVGHRDGSPLLAAAAAKNVRTPCVLFGERPRISDSSVDRFHLDGLPRESATGRSAILVDDSTTDGEMLISIANALRRRGITVEHAFVVFTRTVGGAAQVLEDGGIQLHAILPLSEDDLGRM